MKQVLRYRKSKKIWLSFGSIWGSIWPLDQNGLILNISALKYNWTMKFQTNNVLNLHWNGGSNLWIKEKWIKEYGEPIKILIRCRRVPRTIPYFYYYISHFLHLFPFKYFWSHFLSHSIYTILIFRQLFWVRPFYFYKYTV